MPRASYYSEGNRTLATMEKSGGELKLVQLKDEVGSLAKSVECHAYDRLRNEMKIFVGNLSGETTGDDLRQAFESFGQVRSVTIVMDAGAGKSRGFGFVIMPSANEAKNAIEKINGKNLRGQKIYVEKSRTKARTRSSQILQ